MTKSQKEMMFWETLDRGVTPAEALSMIEDILLASFKTPYVKEGWALKIKFNFVGDPSFPKNFFGNDLDDIISAHRYIVDDNEDLEFDINLSPFVANVENKLYVMYKLNGKIELLGYESRKYGSLEIEKLPLSTLISKKGGDTPPQWILHKETIIKIEEAYDMFHLEKFDYGGYNKPIASIPADYVLNVLNNLLLNEFDVVVYSDEGDYGTLIPPPRMAKSARK